METTGALLPTSRSLSRPISRKLPFAPVVAVLLVEMLLVLIVLPDRRPTELYGDEFFRFVVDTEEEGRGGTGTLLSLARVSVIPETVVRK